MTSVSIKTLTDLDTEVSATDGEIKHVDDDELDEIEEICSAATSGPWYVRNLDDDHAMSLVAVGTSPDDGKAARWPNFDHREIVAATLIQHPRYVDSGDERWDENAAFIAMARSVVPRLVQEVRRLREALGERESWPEID